MERKVFMGRLYSNRREKLVDMCIKLQREGKKFLYIMPSSAAIREVRDKFNETNHGFLGSRVIVFDDLELDIAKGFISMSNIIYHPVDRVIISTVAKNLHDEGKLNYFNKIYYKNGFHDEIGAFIRKLKRECIDEDSLRDIKDNIDDKILKKKLNDILLIYKGYNEVLSKNGLYDRNDISLKAIELVAKYKRLNGIDSIIIDGFTDIERVSMELVKAISTLKKSDIYVNCPYKTEFIEPFIEKEVSEPFKNMGFEIINDEETHTVKESFKDFCNHIFSGNKLTSKVDDLKIISYPCIESELRETARDIKERLLNGENIDDIALFINNRDEYENHLIDIFEEFKVPTSVARELPMDSSELIRKLIKGFESNKDEELPAKDWLERLSAELKEKKPYIKEILKSILSGSEEFEDFLEVKAYELFKELLKDIKQNFEISGMHDVIISNRYFIDMMSEILQNTKVNIKNGNNGGIKILDTALSKDISFKHLYVLGVNEGEIPTVIKNTGLFESTETNILSQYGVKYKNYLWELNREKIRFNLTLSAARESITLSYRTSDEDGRYAIASSFIDEIKFITEIQESKNLSMRDRFDSSYSRVMSRRELKHSFIKNHFERKHLSEAEDNTDLSYVSSKDENLNKLINKSNIEFERENKRDFRSYEGILDDYFMDLSSSLYSFSPSSLKQYIYCPFKYFMSVVLGLGEVEEEEGELSVLEIGSFYHDVLYKYYREAKQFKDFDKQLFDKIFKEALQNLRTLDIPKEEFNKVTDRINGRLSNFIYLDLSRMANYEKETGNALKPYMLEEFLDDHTEFSVRIRCKVDRIDLEYINKEGVLTPTGRYVIYDYKKGKITGINEVLSNEDYQTTIYYHLIDKKLKEQLNMDSLDCMALLYLSIEKTEDKLTMDGVYKTEYKKALSLGSKRSDVNSDKFKILMDYNKGLIKETIDKIKIGKFNYKPLCDQFEGYTPYECEFNKLCRYNKNKVRVLLGELK